MGDIISWAATVATIIAAFLVASNLGSKITGLGFVVFTIGSVLWLRLGIMTDQPALAWTNAVLTVLNMFGIWRWLGRQSRVEEGARTAAQASEETPGEALFPVSLLARAEVDCGETFVGHCIDAMAGCRSGRIGYVVISEGGVAGIGEKLRRLPWARAHVAGDRLQADISDAQFAQLEELSRDQWPGR